MIYTYMSIQMNSEQINKRQKHNSSKLTLNVHFAVIEIIRSYRGGHEGRHQPLTSSQPCVCRTAFLCMQQKCCGYSPVCSYHMHIIGFACNFRVNAVQELSFSLSNFCFVSIANITSSKRPNQCWAVIRYPWVLDSNRDPSLKTLLCNVGMFTIHALRVCVQQYHCLFV